MRMPYMPKELYQYPEDQKQRSIDTPNFDRNEEQKMRLAKPSAYKKAHHNQQYHAKDRMEQMSP